MSKRRGSAWVVSSALSAALVGCVGQERGSDAALTRRYQELQLRSARLRQLAIQLAIAAYRIDVSKAHDGVSFSPHGDMQDREGVTVRDVDGRIRVTLGEDAFTSAGVLGSTIGHEIEVHVNRQVAKGTDYLASDIRLLQQRGRTHYRRLEQENRRRVDEGVYRKW